MFRHALVSTPAVLALLAATATAAGLPGHGTLQRPGGSFALIGDTPYGVAEEPRFERVIDAVNATPRVRFVLHTGDVKQGSERCDDAVFLRRFQQYQRFAAGFVVTPGDNDWTDCHRANNGGYLPTERLARFREIFYPVAGRSSGGRPFALRSQATMPGHTAYVENQMWSFAGTTVATVHVVGSNNNLAPWSAIDPSDTPATPRADRIAEFQAREAAALAWIDAVFEQARASGSAGVVLAMQANPAFELPASHADRQGFNAVLARLGERAKAFGKPVLLAHGDSHYFRLDKPLVLPVAGGGSAQLEHFTRVENFGSPSVHWVEVQVDPQDAEVFRIVPHIVPGNLLPR